LLRQKRFQTVWILDRTLRPAIAAALARIPTVLVLAWDDSRCSSRILALIRAISIDHLIDWLRVMTEMKVPLPSTEPALPIPGVALAAIGEQFKASPRPWIVLCDIYSVMKVEFDGEPCLRQRTSQPTPHRRGEIGLRPSFMWTAQHVHKLSNASLTHSII
jgi:hypothetical protein